MRGRIGEKEQSGGGVGSGGHLQVEPGIVLLLVAHIGHRRGGSRLVRIGCVTEIKVYFFTICINSDSDLQTHQAWFIELNGIGD